MNEQIKQDIDLIEILFYLKKKIRVILFIIAICMAMVLLFLYINKDNIKVSYSLLPESSLFILRKSTILPRVAQLAEKLHQKAQAGERMGSSLSSSAAIRFFIPGIASLI